jgi:hypothetical protein
MEKYALPERKTLKYMLPGSVKALNRHPYNNRRQNTVVRNYAQGVLQRGANWAARSAAIAVEAPQGAQGFKAIHKRVVLPRFANKLTSFNGQALEPTLGPDSCHHPLFPLILDF